MKRILLFFLLTIGIAAHAQTGGPVRNCDTMVQDSINRIKSPNSVNIDQLEKLIERKSKEISARYGARTNGVVLTIPVVVHVVHNGEAVGVGQNISREQIQAQLEVLNEDFRRKPGTPGFNNNPVGADVEIEFCLSPVNDAGTTLSEPGIHRLKGKTPEYTRAQIENDLKPSSIWNPNKFFNIWTVKFGGTEGNLLGYAQFPEGQFPGNITGGQANTDGVVVLYSSFGSVDKGNFPVMQAPYNHGRTLSHETGHWLGLRHIWGDAKCGNDFVDDTPIHEKENRDCPVNQLSCNSLTVLEMPQNYMDYTNDECMNIFTNGQKLRMLAAIEVSPRRKSVTQANLCNTSAGPLVARFSIDADTVLKGAEVAYSDLSSGFPTSWSWTFEGGDPGTSNIQNPQVTYSTPGDFKTNLTVTNAKDETSSIEVAKAVHVLNEGICNTVTNFDATFTPSAIKLKDFGDYTGYLTGHNSNKSMAVSEKFLNNLKYRYVSGINIKFAKAYAKTEGATATILIWNARGYQGGPGNIIERKTVLISQIVADIAANRATSFSFDRETPVFSRAFHVGVEFNYTTGDSLVVESSKNGESTRGTSYVQDKNAQWQPFSTAYGANIAMNITPIVGMNPSVQVSSSKLLINPGEQVVLNARGASIFVWNSDDDVVKSVLGPQLIVNPVKTTVYKTSGSGLDLCSAEALTTVYVRSGTITGVSETIDLGLYPNPGTTSLNVSFNNGYRGPVSVSIRSILNQPVHSVIYNKNDEEFNAAIDTSHLAGGVYITSVTIGSNTYYGKWIRRN